MGSLQDHLRVEIEQINKSLRQLPPSRTCADLSELELAGTAALLHSFYNGVEKMLIEIVKSRNNGHE
jgi:hypothetical protein